MPSLLQRLSDNHPGREEDVFLTANENWLFDELKMLFSSCSRLTFLEDIPLINSSVLNYGINASVTQLVELEQRKWVMEQRIKNVLCRFESRLTDVAVSVSSHQVSRIMFDIHARYLESSILFQLEWDDCASRVSFV